MTTTIVQKLRIIDQLGGAAGYESLVTVSKTLLDNPGQPKPEKEYNGGLTITPAFMLSEFVLKSDDAGPSGTGDAVGSIGGNELGGAFRGKLSVLNSGELKKGIWFVIPNQYPDGKPADKLAMHFMTAMDDWRTVVAVFEVDGIPVKENIVGMFDWATVEL